MRNEEQESFEQFKVFFCEHYSMLKKLEEENKNNLAKINEKNAVHPYYKNKEATSNTVGLLIVNFRVRKEIK